jgi:hypothetical protein
MNLNPDQLVKEIKNRFDHATQKRLLKEKYLSKMTFAHAGGMWQAGPELLTLLQACPAEDAVLLDLYSVPVKVNVVELQHLTHNRWQEQMNAWLIELESMSRNR